MLRLEARPQPSQAMSFASPLLALAITVLIGIVMFALLGKDPLRALQMFFYEPIKSAYAWTEIAVKATPLILIGLGLAICYRSNVWNIGAEGQYVIGAVFASGVAMQATADTPRAIVLLILLAGVAGGMVWAAIVALLRDRFNANEILVSLMLVYVALMVLSYLVYGPWKDPKGYNFPQTITFAAPTKVPRLIEGFRLNIGVLIALAAVALAWLFLFRTYRGFALQVGGLAPAAARYAGFSSRRALWTSMLSCGALAGIAGVGEVIGPIGQLTLSMSPGYGFAAIIVAYVGRLHPIGILFSSFIMALFYIGGELSQSRLGMPSAITGVFQGILLFALLGCDSLIHYRIRFGRRSAGPARAAGVVITSP